MKKKFPFLFIFIILFLTGIGFWRNSIKGQTENMSSETINTMPIDEGDLLSGNWKYIPGFIRYESGYKVHETKLAIVNQDGSLAGWNAPINVGTHLENLEGNFSIEVKVEGVQQATAIIQLYGSLPIIADEFRIERESIQLIIENGKLTARIWVKQNQAPLTQSFAFSPSDSVNLKIARVFDNLVFTINDTQVGTLKESGIFSKGTIWFGFDSKNGEWLLTSLSAKKESGGTFAVSDGSIYKVQSHNPQGLQALATKKRPGFVVGSAMALYPLVSDFQYQKVALNNSMFGSLTPENDMKMINLQPERGIYTFQKADAIVALAKQNGLTIHGHTLVFGEENPVWFNQLPVQTPAQREEIETIMKDHISKVVTHFGNSINSWDVINEPLADYEEFDIDSGHGYRNHKWYRAMGKDYIIKALETAHAANPQALLFINEYGLEDNGERWDFFLSQMKWIKGEMEVRTIPVSQIGVGFQSHVYERGDRINPAVLKQHIETLGALGFKTQISEMDVYSDDGDTVQSKQYADVFEMCVSAPNCIAWRGWILSDRYNYWKDDDGSVNSGKDGLFDSNMNLRPAYLEMQSRIL